MGAVIYTDQFTCYNNKRPSKGWSGVHLLHDNASSHKCEVVKSFLASEKVKVLRSNVCHEGDDVAMQLKATY